MKSTYRVIVGFCATAAVMSVAACGSSGESAFPAAGPEPDAGTPSNGGNFGGNGPASTSKVCARDTDCDDGNACTEDTCAGASTSEIATGHCTNTPITSAACVGQAHADAGASDAEVAAVDANPASCALPPVDTSCGQGNTGTFYPPYVPLSPPFPAACPQGFQLNDARGAGVYTIQAKTHAGAAATTLDVDIATYMVPDGIVITGVDATGAVYTLLDTCRMKTWDQADPTDGLSRPPDETIREFCVAVKPGTRSLSFDFQGVTSPMYLRVLGLCDFDVKPFIALASWRVAP